MGLKPTYGRVSRFGLIAFASSLDQIGPLTRNVKDNALALNAISGYDEKKTALLQGVSVPDFYGRFNWRHQRHENCFYQKNT